MFTLFGNIESDINPILIRLLNPDHSLTHNHKNNMKLLTRLSQPSSSSLPLGSVAQQQRSPEFKQKYQLKAVGAQPPQHPLSTVGLQERSGTHDPSSVDRMVGAQKRTDLPRRRRRDNVWASIFLQWAEDVVFPESHQPSADVRHCAGQLRAALRLPPPSISLRASCLWGGVEVNHRYVPALEDGSSVQPLSSRRCRPILWPSR